MTLPPHLRTSEGQNPDERRAVTLPHQLIEPSAYCRHHPHHRIETRARTAGLGDIVYCYTCSLGYETVLSASNGDEEKADEFVQFLRTP